MQPAVWRMAGSAMMFGVSRLVPKVHYASLLFR